MQEKLLQFKMQKVWVLVDLPYGKRAIGTKWVYRNKKHERGIVIRNKARLIAQGHIQEEGINYEEVFAPVARIEAIRLFLAYASFMGFMVYQMDVKSAFPYETIEEEVYVCQPSGFEDPDHPNKVYKVVKALYGLHQAPRAWYGTLATYLLENGFQRGTIDQTLFIKKQKGDIMLVQIYGLQVKQKKDGIFSSQDKYVAEILRKFRLTEGKSTSTPIDIEKPLLKDPDGEDVDVHTYRSMIGSLMYLTSSRPDIMFATNDVTRLQALVAKKKVVITEATIRDALRLDDAEGVDCLPNEEIFAELAHIGYEKPSTKLTFYKAFFSSQWKFLIHTILQSMSVKPKSWNEFSSAMTSAVICLSTEEQVPDDVDDVATQGADIAVQGDVVHEPSIPSPTPLNPPPQQSQDLSSISQVAQALEITKLQRRVKKQERGNKVKVLKLRRLQKNEEEVKDDQVKGRQAEIYHIDMVHALKVLSMQEDEPEVQEVMDVVTTTKLITEVVSAASESVTAASSTIVSKDKGKRIMVEEPKSLKKKQQVEMDEEKLNEEVEDLKIHLDIVPDEDDDVYTEATPLARKVPVVDYEIIHLNNKPHYKIIRADGTHQLYVSFLTLLKNFDREDLESLWSLVKERFSTSKPNNFSDDFLLTTFGAMLKRPDGQAQVWKSQRTVHGQAKVKSWKLLESCGVHIITFTTTQLILLVERRYLLSRFTLDQMLNAVRLRVEEQSEMSLEILRFTRQQHQEGQLE
nr:putative ribonuclease H-like domain-containing protein [Tanacetum cinerariifolium]